jgi:transcriptional regulator with PAS, ATPase and Fis domain
VHTAKVVPEIDPAALDLLMCYPWPGNIRELENEIERAQILTAEGGPISVRCLSPHITETVEKIIHDELNLETLTLKQATDRLECRMVGEALETSRGNRTLAAKRLGLSRQGLMNKINKFGFNNT